TRAGVLGLAGRVLIATKIERQFPVKSLTGTPVTRIDICARSREIAGRCDYLARAEQGFGTGHTEADCGAGAAAAHNGRTQIECRCGTEESFRVTSAQPDGGVGKEIRIGSAIDETVAQRCVVVGR